MCMNYMQEQKRNSINSHIVYVLPEDDADLLNECYVYTFRAGGKGGQHVNKTDSAVRLVHNATGITVTCSRERSQYLNKKRALLNLRKKVDLLNVIDPIRIPTRVPARVKRKRIEDKSIQSKKKQLRKRDGYFE